MKSLEQRAIERLTETDEYIEQILFFVKKRAQGGLINLSQVVDDLHDAATVAESQRPTREERDSDLGDLYSDQEREDDHFGGGAA